jgi:acetyl-CoA carboxylase carboxyl transferase subunit beta
MSWLTRVVRPKISALVQSAPAKTSETPDNLWHKCSHCGELIFHRDYAANLNVCPKCGHHGRFGAHERLELVFGAGKFHIEPLPKVAHDPIKFKDKKRYSDRLKEATGGVHKDAIMVASGTLGSIPTIAAVFDFTFMGGSMGVAVGEGLVLAGKLAAEKKAALVVIPSSGGARMQEGILSLMQMARTTIATQMVKEAGLPYIVVLADPTTGGVTASFAMLGDVTLAEPGAVIGFAGARVIEETLREKLPEGFQRAEYLLDHGMVDRIVKRADLPAELTRLVRLLHPEGRDKAA